MLSTRAMTKYPTITLSNEHVLQVFNVVTLSSFPLPSPYYNKDSTVEPLHLHECTVLIPPHPPRSPPAPSITHSRGSTEVDRRHGYLSFSATCASSTTHTLTSWGPPSACAIRFLASTVEMHAYDDVRFVCVSSLPCGALALISPWPAGTTPPHPRMWHMQAQSTL